MLCYIMLSSSVVTPSKQSIVSRGSRDLSLGLETSRDSFFKVLVSVLKKQLSVGLLVVYVGHKISISNALFTNLC